MLNLIDHFIILHFPMIKLIDAFTNIGKHFQMLNLIDVFIIIWKNFPMLNLIGAFIPNAKLNWCFMLSR